MATWGAGREAVLGAQAHRYERQCPEQTLNEKCMSDRGQSRRVRKTGSTTRVSVDQYREDPLYPRIARAVEPILARGKVVAPVDVLIGMGILDPAKLQDWRLGRVPYLEKVIDCNLRRLSRLLRILRFHAYDLKLVPSTTAYMRWGKGPKQRLRFTKTGDGKLEEAYSRHFVWPGKGPFHPPSLGQESLRDTGSDGDDRHSQARELQA